MAWEIPGADEKDIEILKKIKHNARKSYSEIADEVGLSRVAVQKRMTALQEKGIIKGYETLVNPTADPNGVKYFMDIETEPELYLSVVEKLAMFKSNRQIYAGTGKCRIHVIGYASSASRLQSNVEQIFSKLKGVKEFDWHVLAVTYKDSDGGIEFERERYVVSEGDADIEPV